MFMSGLDIYLYLRLKQVTQNIKCFNFTAYYYHTHI